MLLEKKIAIAEAIFNGLGTTIKIAEKQMQAATVVCASGILDAINKSYDSLAFKWVLMPTNRR